MSDEFSRLKHTVYLENRESLSIGGVKDVDAFNEEEVTALTDYAELTVKGRELHVEALDLETGVLRLTGQIDAVIYSDRAVTKGFMKKLFS
ncbi:MAG: sporulation protein YabP [Eubacterium sp.]|nr:sporulation protein YabP [Eubacterium sp.]MBR6392472.1 sporulation protein YabP [Eubacterium sp.]